MASFTFADDISFAKIVDTPEGPALLVGHRVIRVQGLKDDDELDAICRALRKGRPQPMSSGGQWVGAPVQDLTPGATASGL